MKIGVLALQGGFVEHSDKLKNLGVEAIEVRKEADLKDLSGLIIPGGESTTMGKLLKFNDMLGKIKALINKGIPVWGTCAGLILLAKEIENEEPYLSVLDIKVKRNAFGTQLDSFAVKDTIEAIGDEEVSLIFIRAPYIVDAGKNVEILYKYKDKIVAVKEKNILATAFHPELSDSDEFHRYFAKICEDAKNLH